MKKNNWNKNWLFYKEGCEDQVQHIDLPHDAMILEQRDPKTENGGATGFLPGGKYIYKKRFFTEDVLAAETALVEFEGAYRNTTVLLNGKEIGGRMYGYSNFFVDLSTRAVLGEENELTVIVDNSQTPNSRWYSGSGIYRPVNLWTAGKRYILPEGVKVKTVSHDPATILITCEAVHAEEAVLRHRVLLGSTVVAETEGTAVELLIPDAKLWSAEHPTLYTLETELVYNGVVEDRAETTFGIRTLAWNAEEGLLINGETVKLRGGCVHHDHGILGACAYEEAELRRVQKLKEFGFNAIRYSHNPAGKAFLRACDAIGMYVVDESFDQWKVPQTTYDYALHFDTEWEKDVCSLVSKDYNHPCVIMYCIGNEITDTGLPFGAAICKLISDRFHALDDTRPTMIAINSMLSTLANLKAKQAAEGTENVGSKEVNDIVALLPKIMASITPESLEAIIGDCVRAVDIVGYNYGSNLYEGTHAFAPERVILSSETFPQRMSANWEAVVTHPYVIGDFHWTAWDYLGEAGVGLPVYGTTQAPFSKDYPCMTAACGSFDLTGFPESAAYYASILWGVYQKPYIGVRPVDHAGEPYTLGKWRFSDSIPCWTWPGCEGKNAELEIFSIGIEIELYQDGQLLARKPLEHGRADFTAIYRPGTLTAISYDAAGAVLGRVTLSTAGAETILQVLPEQDTVAPGAIAFVPIHLTDAAGTLKMTETRTICVQVHGGALVALGSAEPVREPDHYGRTTAAWHGRALAVVRADGTGTIEITASADGLANATARICVK